jgi:hypothetical protein
VNRAVIDRSPIAGKAATGVCPIRPAEKKDSRLSASSSVFLFNTKFTEVANQDILTGFKCVFYDFKKLFYNLL